MPFIFVWTGYLIENDKISHQVLELVLVVKEHNCPWVTIVVQLSPKEFFFSLPQSKCVSHWFFEEKRDAVFLFLTKQQTNKRTKAGKVKRFVAGGGVWNPSRPSRLVSVKNC